MLTKKTKKTTQNLKTTQKTKNYNLPVLTLDFGIDSDNALEFLGHASVCHIRHIISTHPLVSVSKQVSAC